MTPFARVDYPDPHRRQRRTVLAGHPEVRRLIGPDPSTLAWIVALLATQLVSAALVARHLSWPGLVVVAYLAGTFISHGLFVLIHECAHGLVLRTPRANLLCAILANTVHVIPSAISFRKYHLRHHRHQGVYGGDADLPMSWEPRVFQHRPLGPLLWLVAYPALMAVRAGRIARATGQPFLDAAILLNGAVVLGVDALVLLVLGPKALAYLLISFWCGIGPHPLGARWLQEHFVLSGQQETNSYYGPINAVAFNVGHHQEHNDFPGVPWARLPSVRQLAPEVYGRLTPVRSYLELWWRFLRGGISLEQRIERQK